MSVVTIAVYRSVTGDETSASGTVQTWLDDTEQELEEYLDRPLASGEYTDRLRINNERRGPTVYPRATPISDGGDYLVAGHALVGVSPISGLFDQSDPAYAEVTYTGGWSASTLPRCIRDDICWAVRQAVRGEAARVPAGAVSVSMGDASVSFGARPSDPDDRWSRQTRRYRRRHL